MALHRPYGHKESHGEQGYNLMCYILQATPTDKDGSYSIDEVVHGVDIGGKVSPRRHGARRREETR